MVFFNWSSKALNPDPPDLPQGEIIVHFTKGPQSKGR